MIRLCLFDCDGTLVDSQHLITLAMATSFAAEGLPPAAPERIKRVVGLSLKPAIACLLEEPSDGLVDRLAKGYAKAFADLSRDPAHHEPLFPGAREGLARISASGWLLGLATGKSRRGALATLDRHGLAELFVTVQTADGGASKPAPDMVLRALTDTGAQASRAVMVGDTTFDMEMARNARVFGIGVSWGYHDQDELRAAGALRVVDDFQSLTDALAETGLAPGPG
jgi:phosphoglycolate phosphatase